MRELLSVKQVAKIPIKTVLLRIAYAQHAVAEYKPIFIIYPRFIPGILGGPVGHIAAIKNGDPFFLVGLDGVGITAHTNKEEAQKKVANQKKLGGTGTGSHRLSPKGF
jgi:hypothetical protein